MKNSQVYKFEFWREIWMLAGRLLRSFPVHHFRSLPVMQFLVISGLFRWRHCSTLLHHKW